MADWWSDLVAPAGGGKSGLSGTESKELASARDKVEAGREAFPLMAQQYRMASRYPGGIPQALYDKARLAVGSENQVAQDSDQFQALTRRQATAQARLLAPVSNYDMQNLMQSGANPRFRKGVNQELLGLDFGKASRAYFEASFRQRFAAQNGGLNGKDKQGRPYAEALAQAYKAPEVQNLMKPPWERQQQGQRSAPSLPKGVTVEEVPD